MAAKRPDSSPKSPHVQAVRMKEIYPDVPEPGNVFEVPGSTNTADGAKGSVPGGRQAVPAFTSNDPRTPGRAEDPGPM